VCVCVCVRIFYFLDLLFWIFPTCILNFVIQVGLEFMEELGGEARYSRVSKDSMSGLQYWVMWIVGIADGCTNKDISITQSQLGSAAGIPQYSVQIVNTCISDCAPTNIHVYCGWFASSPPPNPNTFTRLAYNDCLVNGGRPLAQGSIVEFQYANSFMYALSFRSANFCRWIGREHQLIMVYVLGLIGPPFSETFDTLPVKNCGTFVEKSDSA